MTALSLSIQVLHDILSLDKLLTSLSKPEIQKSDFNLLFSANLETYLGLQWMSFSSAAW